MLTPSQLIEFEEDIAKCFDQKMIRAPIHLHFGNEIQLISLFKSRKIGPDDWVFSSWRSHYHCLLKGVPPEKLKEEILAGHSITLAFPEHNILCSAIVGGIVPIALGTALALKRDNKPGKVYVMIGDMTSECGITYECLKYAEAFDLPILFVVEDNDKSVCTPTRKTWGRSKLFLAETMESPLVYHYKYENKYPHAGAGSRVQF